MKIAEIEKKKEVKERKGERAGTVCDGSDHIHVCVGNVSDPDQYGGMSYSKNVLYRNRNLE